MFYYKKSFLRYIKFLLIKVFKVLGILFKGIIFNGLSSMVSAQRAYYKTPSCVILYISF